MMVNPNQRQSKLVNLLNEFLGNYRFVQNKNIICIQFLRLSRITRIQIRKTPNSDAFTPVQKLSQNNKTAQAIRIVIVIKQRVLGPLKMFPDFQNLFFTQHQTE